MWAHLCGLRNMMPSEQVQGHIATKTGMLRIGRVTVLFDQIERTVSRALQSKGASKNDQVGQGRNSAPTWQRYQQDGPHAGQRPEWDTDKHRQDQRTEREHGDINTVFGHQLEHRPAAGQRVAEIATEHTAEEAQPATGALTAFTVIRSRQFADIMDILSDDRLPIGTRLAQIAQLGAPGDRLK